MEPPIKFYTDEHVTKAVIKALRIRDIDVLTCQEANMITADDAAHLALATTQNRVLFTQDADFLRLHAQGIPHAGIVFTPQSTPIGEIIRGLMLICQVLNAVEMQGHVEYI